MSTKTCSQTRAIQARRIFPFDVNMHNTLFGGNLTRIIDDCASITVSRHCRRLAVTASVDAMNYLKPLPPPSMSKPCSTASVNKAQQPPRWKSPATALTNRKQVCIRWAFSFQLYWEANRVRYPMLRQRWRY